jgi:hypothetical protein
MRAFLLSLGSRYELVSPQRWKKEYGLIGQEKSQSVIVAERLYPSAV